MYHAARRQGVPYCTGDGERDEAEADAEALEAVENLLESYFVQIDGTFDKLEALGVSPPK